MCSRRAGVVRASCWPLSRVSTGNVQQFHVTRPDTCVHSVSGVRGEEGRVLLGISKVDAG